MTRLNPLARTKTMLRDTVLGVALASVVLGAGAVGVARYRGGNDISTQADAAVIAPAAAVSAAGPPAATLDGLVDQLQTRLEEVPGDHVAWATLGLAYVQQARVVVDPSLYPRAQGALEQSLAVEPDDNFLAFAGLSALASARHDFGDAKSYAEQGLAINAFNPILWGALSDAEVQLGNYAAADAAIERMLELSPDTASYSRASYLLELRGQISAATTLMEQALAGAGTPTDRAFALTILGDLKFNAGDPNAALELYNRAQSEAPEDATALYGKARAEAALGQHATAVDHFSELVDRSPEPSYLIAFGRFLESIGRTAEANEQYEVFQTVQTLFEENGVESDAAPVLFLAEFGERERALAEAEIAIERRPFLAMYDAYAWALHLAGRHVEALAASEQALQLGSANASFYYHSGQIKLALGDIDGGRADLERALAINPFFDPLDAPIAVTTLRELA
jgi:tetratricopeptide (TPR) repeat protein